MLAEFDSWVYFSFNEVIRYYLGGDSFPNSMKRQSHMHFVDLGMRGHTSTNCCVIIPEHKALLLDGHI